MPPSSDPRSSGRRPSRPTVPPARRAVAAAVPRPASVWVVAVLVALEGLGAVVAAVALVVVVVRGTQLAAASITLAVLATGLAFVLAAAARALLAGRRWARSPVITAHVLVVAMSLASWRTAPAPWPALGVALGVVVVVLLLLPSVVAWTSRAAEGRAATP